MTTPTYLPAALLLLLIIASTITPAVAFLSAIVNLFPNLRQPEQTPDTTQHPPPAIADDRLIVMGPCAVHRCASTVSKCQITDACRCTLLSDQSCFDRCSRCLGHLFAECCGCVEMCSMLNSTAATDSDQPPELRSGLRMGHASMTSDVLRPVEGLFAAVVRNEDAGWTTLTYPVGMDPEQLPETDDWNQLVLFEGAGKRSEDR